jgi:hypothetical protein
MEAIDALGTVKPQAGAAVRLPCLKGLDGSI